MEDSHMDERLGGRSTIWTRRRSRLVVGALIFALAPSTALPFLVPDLAAVARADETSGLCAAKLGPLRLEEDAMGGEDGPGGWSWVRCRYDDPRKGIADYASIHVTWVEPGNPKLESEIHVAVLLPDG